MKAVVYTLIILALGMTSCNSDDQAVPGFVSAQLSDESWHGTPEINIDPVSDTLTFLGIGNEQVLVFKIKFDQEGIYDLSENQAIYYTTVGRDALTSSYKLDTGIASQVIITAYDPAHNTLEGSFEIALLQEWSNPQNAIERLRFTNGEFSGRISQ